MRTINFEEEFYITFKEFKDKKKFLFNFEFV